MSIADCEQSPAGACSKAFPAIRLAELGLVENEPLPSVNRERPCDGSKCGLPPPQYSAGDKFTHRC